jgi:hypothetical protein
MKKITNILVWALILAPTVLFLASYGEVVALNLTTQAYSWWNIFTIFA